VRETKFIYRVIEMLVILCILTLVVMIGGILLGGCASDSIPQLPTPSHRKPAEGAKRYYARDGWDIRSEKDVPDVGSVSKRDGVIVWDLKGAILDGSKQKGDGSQNENQEPLFRARIPLVVRNGFVQRNKNAASFYAKDSGVERVTFTDIGEDAVATSKGAYGFRVRDCEFLNDQGGDKSIQLNEARDARVEGNLVFSGRTCMRVGDSGTTAVSETATVKGNRFVGCDTGVHASKITVDESGNTFENVRLPTKAVEGAVFK
jgi:hypothetical protein